MVNVAIQVLWLLVGALALCGVVYLFLHGVKKFIYPDLPPLVEQGILVHCAHSGHHWCLDDPGRRRRGFPESLSSLTNRHR